MLRMPVLNKLAAATIDTRDSYVVAASELMDEAQKMVVLTGNLSAFLQNWILF